ncbi:MAG: DUF5709 domain-containing protein [Actinomycetia bacterium]|nr:DUF5709 domain-containing protein [Actinomycetes bacterium]
MTQDEDDAVADGVDPDHRWPQIPDADALIDRGADTLDEGYIPPDRWSPAQRFGSTAEEMRRGETIDMRLAQEEPDVTDEEDEPDEDDDREVGDWRAGRLVAGRSVFDEDAGGDDVAFEVGISGGAATAEEAAMHVMDAPPRRS